MRGTHAITLEDALFFVVPVRFRISAGIATSSSHYIVVVRRGEETGVGEGFGHLHRVMPFLRRHADEVLRSASEHDFEELRGMARSGKLRLPMGLEIALLDLLANAVAAGELSQSEAVANATMILFAGHSLNIILAMMGVLVHGIRLNTLEFSNQMVLEWSGFAYRPFARKAPADPSEENAVPETPVGGETKSELINSP